MTFGKADTYIPELSSRMISVYKKIKTDFPFLTICTWSTSVINEFMLHQPGKYYQLVEVDKECFGKYFLLLKGQKLFRFLGAFRGVDKDIYD